jgi:hypothetical protein
LEKFLKPGDFVYHREYGHMLVEKCLSAEEEPKTKWECKIIHKKDLKLDNALEVKPTVDAADLQLQIAVFVKI